MIIYVITDNKHYTNVYYSYLYKCQFMCIMYQKTELQILAGSIRDSSRYNGIETRGVGMTEKYLNS